MDIEEEVFWTIEGGQGNVEGVRRRGRVEVKKSFKDCATFTRELLGLSRCQSNRGVVRLLEPSIQQKALYMEEIAGKNLHRYVTDECETLEVPDAALLLLDLARALEFIHSRGVVHADVKSLNCMVRIPPLLNETQNPETRPAVVLIDFGFSEIFEDYSWNETNRGPNLGRYVGCTPGTLGYIAPELIRWQILSSKSDVYSFGATMWEVLSGGREAYPRPMSGARINKYVLGGYHPSSQYLCSHGLGDLKNGENRYLVDLMKLCLDKRPERRPSMSEVVRVLETYQRGQGQT